MVRSTQRSGLVSWGFGLCGGRHEPPIRTTLSAIGPRWQLVRVVSACVPCEPLLRSFRRLGPLPRRAVREEGAMRVELEPNVMRALRGGSWCGAWRVRTPQCSASGPTRRHDILGLRLVRRTPWARHS